MLKKIDIRPASYQDLPRITEILNQAISWGKANAYTELFKTEERKDWLLKHSGNPCTVFVAELNNRVEAYLSISPYREGRQAFQHTAEISYYVDFDHHRKGIASALMKEALVYCRKAHIEILLAFLYDHNKTSVSFLEKHGFKKWGLLPAAARVGSKKYDHAIYGKKLTNL